VKWSYDGSYLGFLSACFRIYEAHDAQARLVAPGETGDLFCGDPAVVQVVESREDLARRVHAGVLERGGEEAAEMLRDAFLHRDPGGSDYLLGFIRRVVEYGPLALQRLAETDIRETERRARGVRREAHKLQGFLRFRSVSHEVGLYAEIRPDHDVLVLLVPHFLDRMGQNNWMIHDRGRRSAAFHQNGRLEFLRGVELEHAPAESGEEEDFQILWRHFFRNIAIPERANPKLQQALMPKKYWAYLTERPAESPFR
jgi:probable DNA metabolism protein